MPYHPAFSGGAGKTRIVSCRPRVSGSDHPVLFHPAACFRAYGAGQKSDSFTAREATETHRFFITLCSRSAPQAATIPASSVWP
jgi:hypothetical protein